MFTQLLRNAVRTALHKLSSLSQISALPGAQHRGKLHWNANLIIFVCVCARVKSMRGVWNAALFLCGIIGKQFPKTLTALKRIILGSSAHHVRIWGVTGDISTHEREHSWLLLQHRLSALWMNTVYTVYRAWNEIYFRMSLWDGKGVCVSNDHHYKVKWQELVAVRQINSFFLNMEKLWIHDCGRNSMLAFGSYYCCTVYTVHSTWIFWFVKNVQFTAELMWCTVSHNAMRLTWPSIFSMMNEPENISAFLSS